MAAYEQGDMDHEETHVDAGQSISEICTEHGIAQSQYYQWRDQFLSNASKAFETKKIDAKHAHLEWENSKLKNLVGELTLEFKKTDELLG